MRQQPRLRKVKQAARVPHIKLWQHLAQGPGLLHLGEKILVNPLALACVFVCEHGNDVGEGPWGMPVRPSYSL
jgi:hypothetical protein